MRISDWSSDVCSSDLQWQARRDSEPGDFGKMAIGAGIMACAMLALAAGAALSGEGHKASIVWPVLAYFLTGFAFMWTWPAPAWVARQDRKSTRLNSSH